MLNYCKRKHYNYFLRKPSNITNLDITFSPLLYCGHMHLVDNIF